MGESKTFFQWLRVSWLGYTFLVKLNIHNFHLLEIQKRYTLEPRFVLLIANLINNSVVTKHVKIIVRKLFANPRFIEKSALGTLIVWNYWFLYKYLGDPCKDQEMFRNVDIPGGCKSKGKFISYSCKDQRKIAC